MVAVLIIDIRLRDNQQWTLRGSLLDMDPIYGPCPCDSGMKFKFCCLKKNPQELLKGAAKFPLYECLRADNGWERHGMAVLYVCRQLSDRYICAAYMVDTYCLGLKNTFVKINLQRDDMLDARRRLEQNGVFEQYDYEDARSLILGAIEYAASLGFQPNEDWQNSRYVVEEERPYHPKFEYGQDGKPLYIQGPNDDATLIMSKLAAVVDHHYLVRAN